MKLNNERKIRCLYKKAEELVEKFYAEVEKTKKEGMNYMEKISYKNEMEDIEKRLLEEGIN
jgi:hypothetical protein